MTTAITILETIGVFFVGFAARAALVVAVFAALALPIVAVAWVLRAFGEFWNSHVGHHGPAAHAHR